MSQPHPNPNPWLYPYPPLQAGILLRRYKRFFADIQLTTGEEITAHCPNTGPMTGISTPGSPVQVSYHPDPKRKLAYTWEMIQVNDNGPAWFGVNTSLPNRVVAAALDAGILPELAGYAEIKREVTYGQERSRIDFFLTSPKQRPTYVEVKSTTWATGELALFPDTVTTRGQKHLRELMALIPTARVCMLYFINRGDCPNFAPGDTTDPTYGELLRQARERGLEVLPYRFEITPTGIQFCGRAACQF
ncbi:DNA/RNA nuclease SfsA [Synechococcus sp. PCC 6312]|uniref:DNA/RNA nuclease SfsA n=1 Tax=Synechococcus sp. (strain ATCC 27167 / PCC 6312) TaxID=195253 RepID=UPI00029F306F|nr:DNA/RNA nuclease SfsA [Synechococcus sp. PCC 6312]AFY61490.1 sugar fermentation stimulation protein [Synechococcus sp. PCC 6312]